MWMMLLRLIVGGYIDCCDCPADEWCSLISDIVRFFSWIKWMNEINSILYVFELYRGSFVSGVPHDGLRLLLWMLAGDGQACRSSILILFSFICHSVSECWARLWLWGCPRSLTFNYSHYFYRKSGADICKLNMSSCRSHPLPVISS